MNVSDFNELPWHDAILQTVLIDRKNPGEKDNIKLFIKWQNNNSSIIEFHDCYSLIANMNFGVVACESIMTAECITNSEELNLIRKKWAKFGVNLENLKSYKIITNSTNSILNIFALKFKEFTLQINGQEFL